MKVSPTYKRELVRFRLRVRSIETHDAIQSHLPSCGWVIFQNSLPDHCVLSCQRSVMNPKFRLSISIPFTQNFL